LVSDTRDVRGHEALEERLHQLEDNLRLLLKHVPAVTWTTDKDLRFTSIEGPALPTLGLDAESVVGKHLKDVQVEGDSGVLISPRALAGEVVSSDHRWMGRQISTTIEPLRDLDGNIVGTMGVAVLLDDAAQVDEVRSLQAQVHDARFQALGVQIGDALYVGPLMISRGASAAWKDNERLSLSSIEFKLLAMLAENEGHVLSREDLVRSVWGYEFLGESRLVDMTISRLRQKVEEDPSNPKLIMTVRGAGYRLET
jgi:hypothetical protein